MFPKGNSEGYSSAKWSIEEKAIQKYPFTLNNETYFAIDSYFEDTIINGVSLSLKSAKGISNEAEKVGYLKYSHKVIFYAGSNIIAYNTYKRNYEIISYVTNLQTLKALSLSTFEKQYIIWSEVKTKSGLLSEIKKTYHISMYDLTRKEEISNERFLTVAVTETDKIQLFAFMHPIKIQGIISYDMVAKQSKVTFKKMLKYHTEFQDQCQLVFPYKLLDLTYDIESNTYLFINEKEEVCGLRVGMVMSEEGGGDLDNFTLLVEKIIEYRDKRILHIGLNDAYLVLLVADEESEQDIYFEFYSIFSYDLIFRQRVDMYINEEEYITRKKINEETEDEKPLSSFQINKSVIIGIRAKSTCISIYSLHQQNLRHIRNTTLGLDNCYEIVKSFINPFSSQVLILSRHYELEGTLTAAEKSRKVILQSEIRYKNFYLEASSFFITTEASTINVEKLSLGKKKYCQILTAPWINDFIIQSQNSILYKNREEKFDAKIVCSTLHPTSQYIALGFKDHFKIYYLTYEKLEHTFVSENVKECTSIAYSRRGNELAVSTSCMIFIYDCYSFVRKFQISVGVSYKIEEIFYFCGNGDSRQGEGLHCTTQSKRIIVYNSDYNYKEGFSFNPKNHVENALLQGILGLLKQKQANSNKKFGAIVYDSHVNVVIFSYGNKMYFISSKNYQSLGSFDFEEVSCFELCRSISTLFIGTASGKIIAFPWPNKPINITLKLPTFQVHNSRVRKIKLSSDLFYLISVTDESCYFHSITLIKEMRKIEKYELQREFNPQAILVLDFFKRQGICIFSVDQYNSKLEEIKENQQEAVNLNFILPEEREKQKNLMLGKLSSDRDGFTLLSQEECLPIKTEAYRMKQKIKSVSSELVVMRKNFEAAYEEEMTLYEKNFSRLCVEKEQLHEQHKKILEINERQVLEQKRRLGKEAKSINLFHSLKIEEISKTTDNAKENLDKTANVFHELPEIEEEKKIFNKEVISKISQEAEAMKQRNGYLLCRNLNLQKEIDSQKRKIEELKDLNENIQRNIDNLPRKASERLFTDNIKEQKTINKQFADTERNYLEETKKLIEKNKAINVSISLYEKERDMLVILEKQLEKQQTHIDQIIEYLRKERINRQSTELRVATLAKKAAEVVKLHKCKNSEKIKVRNDLQDYKYNIFLYLQGVITFSRLQEMSKISPKDMIKAPENISLNMEEKKKRIQKILNSEQKIMNVMKNDRKIFSNEKKKITSQNQDLLVNFNFLSHQNKHLVNVINSQKERKRYCYKTLNSQRLNRKPALKQTQFQEYLSLKTATARRMKTSPCAEHDFSSYAND